MSSEVLFFVLDILLPFRTSIIVHHTGSEFVELAAIRRIIFSERKFMFNVISMEGSLFWLSYVLVWMHNG